MSNQTFQTVLSCFDLDENKGTNETNDKSIFVLELVGVIFFKYFYIAAKPPAVQQEPLFNPSL